MDSRIPNQAGAPLHGDAQLAFATGHDAGIKALEELGVHDVREKQQAPGYGEEGEIRFVPTDEETLGIGKGMTAAQKVDKMEEIALYALHVEDDPTLNPWTVCGLLFVGLFELGDDDKLYSLETGVLT